MSATAIPASLTLIIVDDADLVSYSMGPGHGNYVERRIITNAAALMDAAEATTVSANVDDGDLL